METTVVPASVRARIGVEASEGRVEMFSQYQQFSTDRYERRLMHEVGALRLELHDGLAALRVELERTRSDVIKWNLLMWIGQFAAMVSVMSYMLNGR
jgi:hypothetical protein